MLRNPSLERVDGKSELSRVLAEQALDHAAFLLDRTGRIQDWNRSGEELFGYQNELLGQSGDVLFTPEDVGDGKPRRELDLARDAGRSESDAWHVRKDGTRLWCRGLVTPLWDAPGELRGYVKILKDRTEWKRQEEQRERRQWIETLLIESGSALFASLDFEATIARVVRLCVPTLADWAMIDIVTDQGHAHRIEVAHADAQQRALAERLKQFAPRWDFPDQPSAAAILSGRSLLFPEVTEELLHKAAQSPEHERLLREIAPRSGLAIPLVVAGKGLGALTLLRTDGAPPFGEEEILAIEQVSQRAAIAVLNARLYQQVEEEHETIRSITANAATGIFTTDGEGLCTFMNPAAVEMLGFTFEDLKDRRLADFLRPPSPPRDPAQPPSPLKRVRYEAEFTHKTGKRIPVRCWTSGIFRGGKLTGTVLEVHDISGEKRARQEMVRLLTQEQGRAGKLQRLTAASLRIHSSVSLENVLQAITKEAQQLIGAHQVVSTFVEDGDWTRCVRSASLSNAHARWTGTLERREMSALERLVCESNRTIRLSPEELEVRQGSHAAEEGSQAGSPLKGWLAAPFTGRDGQNLGLIQLSEKTEGEFALEDEAMLAQLATIASVAIENARLYEALRDADRRKDEFLAMLAHELRNPLAPIRSGLELMSLGEQDAEVIELMQHQVDHLVHLVDDLLDVSRIMRGKIELRKALIDLNVVLSRAIQAVRPLMEARGHQLLLEISSEPMPLRADPVRLTQILTNLLSNAAKYTEPGGNIWVETRLGEGHLAIAVRDAGIGIEPELLPHVFDLFRQAEQSIDRSDGGLGIGLTIVKSLVEMHGGRVTASSDGLGQGSEFTVWLPMARESPPAPPGEHAVLRDPRRLKVLVVDDNVSAVTLLSRLLEKIGQHSVVVAHDGRQAIVLAERESPDIILLDIGLPEMSGYEVARTIRRNPRLARTRLIALTGYGTEEDRRRSREAGCDDHLVKPPSVELLRQAFARFPGQAD